jgi:hypothetical protein
MPGSWEINRFDDLWEIAVRTDESKHLLFANIELPVTFDISEEEGMKIMGSNGVSISVIPDEEPTQVTMEASDGSHAWIEVSTEVVNDIAAFIQREHRNRGNNNGNNIRFNNVRNVPENATNAVTFEPIQNGNEMVTFHGNLNRPNAQRYYKRSTFNSIATNSRSGLKRNPFTRQNIRPTNVRGYTARIQRGGKKQRRKTRRSKRA